MSFPPRCRCSPPDAVLRRIAFGALLVVTVAACEPPQRSAPAVTGARSTQRNALTVRDDFGSTVALRPTPRRVVSLNPTTTELIFALGAGDHLVGRSRWDQWPAAAREVPALGDAIHPQVEQIIAAHPDLVLLYASEDNRAAYDRLRAAGIRALALRIDHVAQFEHAARLLGRALGDSAAGDSVADSVAATLDAVRSATHGLPRPTVVWPVSDSPPIVIGGGSYMSELLDIAGATNVYGSLASPSPMVSIEDVVARNPDIVIRGGDGLPSRAWNATWSVVPAVREGHVVSVSTELVSRPSVQLGEAAVALARALHPGAVLP